MGKCYGYFLAERVGFEPTMAKKAITVFETVPFNHSGTSPREKLYHAAEKPVE